MAGTVLCRNYLSEFSLSHHAADSVIVPIPQVQRLRLGEVIQSAHHEDQGLSCRLAASQNPT